MYCVDDFIQLSALQHFVFCPRQCALIHIEQAWEENVFTAEGRILHEKTHEQKKEKRGDVRIERGMPLRSFELGLSGKADVVEFHKCKEGWILFPVEYKRGKPKEDLSDKVQLCAQALCLEEMVNVNIPQGALFYGKTRHRFDVQFDDILRSETKKTALRLHDFLGNCKTPTAAYAKKCDTCSLIEVCMPKLTKGCISVEEYILREIKET